MTSPPVMRAIGKHNTYVVILDHGQDVQLWDWTLLNAIKAEDDKSHALMHAYSRGTYKGTTPSQLKISQQANARCVALLQSSLSQDAIHLVMDLQDACTMRKRLLDVFGNETSGEDEKTVLLLLQVQQNKLTIQQYAKEMRRRLGVCKRFGIELSKSEQIQAVILGLSPSTYDEERKVFIADKLTRGDVTEPEEEQDHEVRCLRRIFDP
ncbi:uncharacterized protein FA14DRAFT_158397 [Meira miltonrushii]|uniref:Uncharacterized protein n=1 Tax=Meira miltonrushii TaxID=1280837 RepID=A0A316V1Z9_9BASI|nr:uncharacterized protein FA14DRAFT_158397 [Meira miltonrushii]PWN31579.1 hypothetical protein FA14DRAFT_158397 [Meira miltonrushii]